MKTLFFVLSLLTGWWNGNPTAVSLPTPPPETHHLNYPLTDYDKMWKKIADLESKNMTKDALKVAEEIYSAAKSEKNDAQLIKALLHVMKYNQVIEEKSDSANMARIEKEISSATMPTKQLLLSIQADMYNQYYNAERWRIQSRTATDKFDPLDYRTWDASRYTTTIRNLHLASLQSPTALDVPIDTFKDILVQDDDHESATYRPTVFDLLAHRAIDFFNNTEMGLTRPANEFLLSAKDGLSDTKNFLNIKFDSPDSTSHSLHAAHLFQQLLTRHKNNPQRLIDVELKRLKWAKNHSVGADKDTLFMDALETLTKEYPNEPEIGYVYAEIIQLYISRGNKYEPLVSDKYRYDYVMAKKIADYVTTKFPNTAGAKKCAYFSNELLHKHINVEVEDISIPLQSSLAKIHYRNHFKWHLRIIPRTESNENAVIHEYNTTKRAAILTKIPALNTWSVDFPQETDYQSRSTEIIIPGLPAGKYWILASDNPEFSVENHAVSYTNWEVVTFGYHKVQNLNSRTVEYFVNNRYSSRPMPNVQVKVSLRTWNSNSKEMVVTPSGITDANGYCKISLPPRKIDNNYNYYYYKTTFEAGKEKYETSEAYYYDYQQEDREEVINETMFFTDRAIYRPGQTIYFKGLCTQKKNNKSTIQANHSTTVIFRDVNYQELGKIDVVTNEFGTFNGTFTAPTSGLMGQMNIYDTESNGTVFFHVEEYKRPKFEVTFQPLEGSYRLNDEVTAKGSAMGYAGNAVDGAKVKYRVVRQARFPWWGYYCWWRPMPTSPEVEIANGESQTDAAGNFTVKFTAIPDASIPASDKPEFSYSVIADVVDITGETHSATQSIQVGYIGLRVSLGVSPRIENIGKDSLGVFTTNLNGVAEPTQGKVEIYRLQSPDVPYQKRRWSQPTVYTIDEGMFRRTFPSLEYKNESDYHAWKRGDVALSLNFDTQKNKNYSLKIPSAKAGKYVAELTTKDKFGNEIKIQEYFDIYEKNAPAPALPVVLDFSANQTKYEIGETVEYSISTSEKDISIVFQIDHDGKLLDRKFITLSREKRTFKLPVIEDYKGGINITGVCFYRNNSFNFSNRLEVPWSDKELKMEWMTFRNKVLPGSKEEWRLKITGYKSEKVAAEMVASLYDASLEQFAQHRWDMGDFYPNTYAYLNFEAGEGGAVRGASILQNDWNRSLSYKDHSYDYLNLFNFYFSPERFSRIRYKNGEAAHLQMMDGAAEAQAMPTAAAPVMGIKQERMPLGDSMASGKLQEVAEEDEKASSQTKDKPEPKKPEVSIRKNLQETAFFFPQLRTNEKGEIILSFTMPEALTKWKFMGYAHTPDLKTGYLEASTITQKDLMIQPNAPRFLRVGDTFAFSAKVSNLSDKELSGNASLKISDALTGKDITAQLAPTASMGFTAKSKQSALVTWEVNVPENVQGVVYQVIAQAGEFSDGEENMLPVVLNKMLVTESLPLWVKGNSKKDFVFTNLTKAKESNTLRHQQFTLEFTSNPAWYAVQALPYLMEYPHECSEQMFSRYYANTIASHIANSSPRIRQIFDQWKQAKTGNEHALLSNLSKNQELKSALLEETPWVLNANNETERKKRVGLLFDLNKMADEQARAEKILSERQNGNGSFSWFPGMREDSYISQLIATGIGHLIKLKVNVSPTSLEMAHKAVGFVDDQMRKEYDRMKRDKVNLQANHLGYNEIQYLYMRSFFPQLTVENKNKEMYNFYWGQAKKYGFEQSHYMRGMVALALFRGNESATAKQLIESIKQNSVRNEELGMYWKDNSGWWWWEAPIERQALLIEAFQEITQDTESVDEMKVWLLKNKQTTDWKTTRATVEACNALLLTGDNLLASSELVEITLGGVKLDPSTRPGTEMEAGTGYFKTTWQASEITPEMGKISLNKKDKGPAWGGVYWQYFENLDKIKYSATPLAIKKQLFIERNSPTGPKIEPLSGAVLKQGDKVIVRVEIRTDRDMEYVHLKDMRAAGFEPTETLSQYKYQDGLGYYQSTRDLGTHFFIDYLPKGTYVFEYPLRATHKGDFSNGITTMQSMYAPEFTTHSEGIRVKIQ